MEGVDSRESKQSAREGENLGLRFDPIDFSQLADGTRSLLSRPCGLPCRPGLVSGMEWGVREVAIPAARRESEFAALPQLTWDSRADSCWAIR
jgi:hypothetical protein